MPDWVAAVHPEVYMPLSYHLAISFSAQHSLVRLPADFDYHQEQPCNA